MTYEIEFSKEMERILDKLHKKNRKQIDIKPFRHDMKGFRRVHIDKSFVLVFRIIEETKMVKIEDFDHHDNIYNH